MSLMDEQLIQIFHDGLERRKKFEKNKFHTNIACINAIIYCVQITSILCVPIGPYKGTK